MLRVHLGGLRNVARGVLPSMIARRTGPIVAITSELASAAATASAHYAAAKGCDHRAACAALPPRSPATGSGSMRSRPAPPIRRCWPPTLRGAHRTILPRCLTGGCARPDEVAAVVGLSLVDDADFCIGEVLSPNSGAVI